MALFKKKDKDTKKVGETTIGKIIYGFLLFMPLLSISARCLYVIFNKNAYQSYANQQSLQYSLVDNQSTLDNDKLYQFTTSPDLITSNISQPIYVSEFSIIGGVIGSQLQYAVNVDYFYNYRSVNGQYIAVHHSDGTSNFYFQYANSSLVPTTTIVFTFKPTRNVENPYLNYINLLSFGEQNYLDNVFECSIEQTQESNLYNWAKDTGTYTVLYNTTTGLGITNEFVPMLMAYWLIISVIYFLFDIALILIWAVHKKIHELTEAI